MTPYLQVEALTKSFGDLVLFQNISFGIAQGQRIGLIAQNGAGKTTLLNILAGLEGYDDGRITYQRDLRVAYLQQDPQMEGNQTVLEACFRHGNEVTRLIAEYEKVVASGNVEALQSILPQMDALKAWDYEQRIKQILFQLKINDLEQKIATLSGGQRKRVALANVLITEPDLIILDEPTNHLDLEMTEWLEDYLSRSRLSILMVTHDRYFLDRVCSEIIEIDQRQIFSYKGNYSYFLEKREQRLQAQSAEVDRASNLLRKELEWMRRQPQARGTKAKSRIDAFYELEQKAKQPTQAGNVKLEMKGAYIGNKIFEMNNVCKSFGEKRILQDFSYIFSRYEKMGIVGSNGTGKSTFLKLLMGQVQPDSGTIDIGETVRFGYYSQDGLQFDENAKVIDIVKDIAEVIDLGNGSRLTASQFLQHFLFPPEKQHSFVYKLSGGERRRLYLCTVLMQNPNFLVLDEPTNDLDIVTLNVLEDYLSAFKGCVIVVSHDRYFMDKVVHHLLAFSGDARIKDFPGNYTQYRLWKEEADRQQKRQEQAVRPVEKPKSDRPDRSAEKRKLSFNEKREFEQLDAEIPQLEARKSQLEAEMSSGTLDANALISKGEEIARLIDQIEEKTLRWMELSEWME